MKRTLRQWLLENGFYLLRLIRSEGIVYARVDDNNFGYPSIKTVVVPSRVVVKESDLLRYGLKISY